MEDSNPNTTATNTSPDIISNDESNQTDSTYSNDRNMHQATANATNGNALTIGGDNPGIMANNVTMRDKIDNQTNYIYGSCPPLSVPNEKLDPSKIFKDLPAILLEDAKKTLYQPDSSEDQTFSLHAGYVPLQISLFQQNNDTNTPGHSHTRREIIDSYKKIDSKNIEPEEFFEEAENFIRGSDFYQKIQPEKEKENYLHYKSKIIGVIGQAGVGKSTLIKNLFQQFVDKEQLYQAKYVIKINLRDFYDKSEISLFQFLLGENACGFNKWTKNENICTEVFKLLADEESVCILLDGLDEAKFNPKHKVDVNANNFLKQTPGNFLLALLCGQLLPKTKLIITSRPGPMLDLPSKYKPKFILTISGITQEGVKQICQNMCGDDAPQVYSHIQNQPDLKSYSLVPINCVLIIHCIYKFLLSDKFESLPNNMTGVFVLSFLNFLGTNHNVPRNSNKFNLGNLNHLKNISQLAWSGFRKRQFHFDDNDLKHAGLNHVDISSVTVTVKRQNHINHLLFLQNATSNCTYFSHLLIQEFFSAIYCLFFMDSKTFENTFFSSKQFDLQSNEFLMVTKFFFGLSNSNTLRIFDHSYPDISDPTEHIKLLKDLTKTIASTACTIEVEFFQPGHFRSLLNVCSWLYEFQDLKFSEQISDTLPTNIKLYGDILPSDVLSFCYVIKTRTNYLSLEIHRPNFVENALWLLGHELQFIQTNSTVQLNNLKLHTKFLNLKYENKKLHVRPKQIARDYSLIDEKIAEVLCDFIFDNTQEIEFYHCNVTPQGMKKISTRISNLTCPLQSLDLSGSKIGDSGFESVATCVHKINQLSIDSWNDKDLTLDGVKALVEGIKASPPGLNKLELNTKFFNLTYKNKKLHVGSNEFFELFFIDDETAEVLCDFIFDNTEEIKFYHCNVTPQGMKKISTRISNLTCPLQSLKLMGIKIGDSAFESVATCVHNINQLSIGCEYHEDLTLDGVKALVEAIKTSPLVIQSLDLNGIKIGDSGFQSVATSVHKINQLSIGSKFDEDLSLDGVKALVEGIKASPFGLNNLQLSTNCLLLKYENKKLYVGSNDFFEVSFLNSLIDEKTAEVLCDLISDNTEEIEIHLCNVTPRGMKKILTRISNLTCPLQSLNLSWSKIGDSGFQSVATCVHKIYQLSIGSFFDEDLTLDGVKALVEGIKSSPLGMEKLWIYCPDEMKSVVRQELLGLKNKVDCVKLNEETLFDDRSTWRLN